jgi:stage II sporulation protein D
MCTRSSSATIARATAGWVLSYRGQVVTAPYHSACGGTTALPSEVWRGGQDGYLRSVSDTAPGTGRPWCDLSPRVNWERRLSVQDLAGGVARYAPASATVPAGATPSIRDVRVEGMSATGRVKGVVFAAEGGDVTIRGNDVRYVLRQVGGGILPTTAFSVETERGDDGELLGIVIRGRGNGHGVGMCQWGAIARARAGDDFRAILKAYYPGASLTRAS